VITEISSRTRSRTLKGDLDQITQFRDGLEKLADSRDSHIDACKEIMTLPL
jgi:hypothetical protein